MQHILDFRRMLRVRVMELSLESATHARLQPNALSCDMFCTFGCQCDQHWTSAWCFGIRLRVGLDPASELQLVPDFSQVPFACLDTGACDSRWILVECFLGYLLLPVQLTSDFSHDTGLVSYRPVWDHTCK